MKSILYLLLFSFSPSLFATENGPAVLEICDNGVDDDGDGLVDLNDPDCECPIVEPLSLIPNPSFEDQNCCPTNRSQLDCATGWIQASEATTDYLHTCGWMGWPDLPVPLPFPDGDGCVGFRNGRAGGFNDAPLPNWKEYSGACLLNPLKAGVNYRFQFYMGFTKPLNSLPTNIVFYGSTDCANLPFGINNESFGCPLNGPGWVELGRRPVIGANEWKLYEIDVTPTEDIYAMAIGPDCVELSLSSDTYYFFDNLVLASQSEFDFQISSVGHPCSEDITLKMPFRDTLQYQWYKDGVALVGKTGPELTGVGEEGKYQVRLLGPYSCRVTDFFSYTIPTSYSIINMEICHGEHYSFLNNDIYASGQYVETVQTKDGCDSTIIFNLTVKGENADTINAKIFQSEFYEMAGRRYTQPGEYDANLNTYDGCDSLLHLNLDFYKIFIPNAFSPNADGLNDAFTIYAGDDVQEVLSMKVFNRWGGLVFDNTDLEPNAFKTGWDGKVKGKPATPGVYTYLVRVIFDDGKERLVSGSVTLMR